MRSFRAFWWRRCPTRVSRLRAPRQYEDVMEPYLAMTKAVYKDLVSVHKGSGGAPEAVGAARNAF